MLVNEFAYTSATELLSVFRTLRASPSEVIASLASRIERLNPIVNAFTTTSLQQATEQAIESSRRYATRRARPLEGIPVAIKDIIDTAGIRTTYGSQIFRSHVPTVDATTVRALLDAGAIVIGKTATHEFAWGITTDGDAYGPTRNPWSLDHTAGGSSGGSAAALAAGMVPLALGTDTVGSIRIPSAFCGSVGFKPSAGAVSRAGVFPLAPTLDHVGPMARTVTDANLLFEHLRSGSLEHTLPGRSLGSITVGIYDSNLEDHAEPNDRTSRALYQAGANLAECGVRVRAVDLARLPDAYRCASAIVAAEGLQVHKQAQLWPQLSEGYGPDVAARIHRSANSDGSDYLEAQLCRAHLLDSLWTIFAEVDVILTRVSSAQPLPLGDLHGDTLTQFRQRVMTYTALANVAGLPAVAVRAGFDERELPIGVQIVGRPGEDDTVLAVAQALVSCTPEIQARTPTLTN